jgi:hypothetical protein
MPDREQTLRYAAGMPGPGDRYAQIGRSVLPVQIGTIPGTQNWDVMQQLSGARHGEGRLLLVVASTVQVDATHQSMSFHAP